LKVMEKPPDPKLKFLGEKSKIRRNLEGIA
jgi:hypothetical protein